LNKIDENWDLFEHKTKIRTCFKKLNENWNQKGILTIKLKLIALSRVINTSQYDNHDCST